MFRISSDSVKAQGIIAFASWKSAGSRRGISMSRAKWRDSPSLTLERAPGSSQVTRSIPPLVPDPVRWRRKSEATLTPFCFMTHIDRSPEKEAAAATSMATFSFADHST